MRSAWVEINVDRLTENVAAVKRRIGSAEIIGVVKANAYGHGAVGVGRAYLDAGVDLLAVATLAEAKQLRDAKMNCGILILGVVPDEFACAAGDLGVIPLISTVSCAEAFSAYGKAHGRRVPLMIKVDTGMGRIGFPPTERGADEVASISHLPGVRLFGLMTHFSSADLEDLSFSYAQKEAFDRFYEMLCARGVYVPLRTAANSPAIFRLPEAFYEAVRPGTVLWGCYPACVTNREAVPVKPVMSVKCKVIFVKTVPPGTPISYRRKFITRRRSVIATLPLGYADGYTRALMNKSRVLIHGAYAPVLGTICMDQIMVDVTDVPDVCIGDEAVVLGRQGDREITIEELETASGLCSGELFCGFGRRLPICFVRGGNAEIKCMEENGTP
ncbi:MAG: alanine racemase [Oscillospiraceae bacterium]|nr:alanine racemase [Oscillospiraceae bacterium]